jgi:serine/threonine protein kinase
MPIAEGMKLGPFEIQQAIGAGGMGEVYRARDTRLARQVAVKVLPSHLSTSEDLRKRFEQEARAASSLNHPNICTLYDIGNQDSIHYLVMEYLSGETLRSRLKEGPIPPKKAIEFAVQIAHGLGAAHENGVVHRDLKPENIFITTEERIKIFDFGLAHYTASPPEAELSVTPTRTKMTEPGMVMGTAGYMSPEQVRGMQVNEASDIFSLGVVLYEMLTGQRAFQRDTPAETMTAILKEEPTEINSLTNKISPALALIVQRCLEKKPELRFRTAQDLAFALQMASSGTEARHAVVEPATAASHISKKWLALGLLLLVSGVVAGIFLKNRQQPATAPEFRALTFLRGYVQSANFTPDGLTVIYGAAFGGQPIQLYSTRTDSIESRSLGLPSTDVLSISRSGEMAILLNPHYQANWIRIGTLAKLPVAGGAPREILENVNDADINKDGSKFAIVRTISSLETLEYPIGKVLFETHGWITRPHLSSDEKRIAFIEHPIYGDDRGFIAIAENGKIVRITGAYPALTGLAWSPEEDEIWFSASTENEDHEVWAVHPGRSVRLLLRAPVSVRLADVNSNGRVLLTSGERRSEIGGLLAGDLKERDLSWYGDEDISGISGDATILAATQTAQGSGPNYHIYFRRADGSANVQLGEGNGAGISFDGKLIVALIPSDEAQNKLLLYPTGPGEIKTIRLGDIQFSGAENSRLSGWTTDGRRICFLGVEPGKPRLAYVLDLPNGKPRSITSSETLGAALSMDGGSLIAVLADGRAMLYSVQTRDGIPVSGMLPYEYPLQWENSGKAVFVWDRSFPAKVFRIDITSGRHELWKDIAPPDPIGVLYGRVLLTPDGKHYLYRYRRILNRLYLAEKLQ